MAMVVLMSENHTSCETQRAQGHTLLLSSSVSHVRKILCGWRDFSAVVSEQVHEL